MTDASSAPDRAGSRSRSPARESTKLEPPRLDRAHPDAALPDDATLNRAILSSEPWAAAVLYRKLRPEVRRVLKRFLKSTPTDVDDLFQITFERIIKTIVEGRTEPDVNLTGWAITIAVHAAIDHHRARARELRLFTYGLDAAEFVRIVSHDDERLEARSATHHVMAILQRMNSLDARALMLRHGFGCTVADVAERIGASHTAAGSRLIRAKREFLRRAGRLKQQL